MSLNRIETFVAGLGIAVAGNVGAVMVAQLAHEDSPAQPKTVAVGEPLVTTAESQLTDPQLSPVEEVRGEVQDHKRAAAALLLAETAVASAYVSQVSRSRSGHRRSRRIHYYSGS